MKEPFSIGNDLIENPNARVPICFVLDTSGSMRGSPIQELNEGLALFFKAIRSDEVAKVSVEIAVVTFGEKAHTLLDFGPLNNQDSPVLKVRGGTIMGGGVSMALDLIETRKNKYWEAGLDYYQPWMVLMTDGRPGDKIELSVIRTVELVQKKKLVIFPIGVGSKADLSTLSKFSPTRNALRLKGLNFRPLFKWLSQSVSAVSRSSPGDTVELDVELINEWAEL